jgi:Spy/CpxP family protein refolding chaperone
MKRLHPILLLLIASNLFFWPVVARSQEANQADEGFGLWQKGAIPALLFDFWQEMRDFRSSSPPLSDQQRADIRSLLLNYKPQISQCLRDQTSAHRALREAIQANPANQTQIASAAAQVGKAAEQSALLRAQITRTIRAVLTADQLKALATFQEALAQTWDNFLAKNF